jgi:putative endonuclease
MHYTYVLLSEKDQDLYIGATHNLKARIEQHRAGRVESTQYRRPLTLVYYEACPSPEDAFRRERYLKSGRGGRYLRQRLASSLSLIRDETLERR